MSLPFKICWMIANKQAKDKAEGNYLHPAALRRWAYILPMSPMPMMPIEASSMVRPILATSHTWLILLADVHCVVCG